MTSKLLKVVFAFACLVWLQPAMAAFKDFKVDLTNGNLLTEAEVADKSMSSFGIALGDDGTVTRVGADDASAVAVLGGKYHSNEHGWGNFSSTVAVDGPVKISMGTCAWGGDVTVKNAAGETVATFNTNTGACFHGNKEANIASEYYKGDATTLTISGGSYTPYFAVEAVDPSTLRDDITVTYSIGDIEGVAPAEEKVEIGKTFTIPANFSVYREGKTLVGWSDGSKNYEIGEIVTAPAADVTLTPVFVDNAISLADRKDAVTVRWDFQRKNGAPNVAFQGKKGYWVAQVTIGTETIDVQLPFDTTSGKIANGSWSDWAQMNGGTTFTVPSCEGATISLESYGATTTTTVDGQNMGDGTTNPAYTVMGKAETVELVIGDGSYFRYIQVILPYVKPSLAGTTFDNTAASVIWAFNSINYNEDVVGSPEGAFSVTAFDPGVCSYKKVATTTVCPDVNFAEFNSKNGGSDIVKWCVKPAKGLTFTPTKISFYIMRDGTDGSEKCVSVMAEVEGGESITLDAITPHRNNKTQAEDKWGSKDSYTTLYERELTAAEQEKLTSGEGFNLVLNNGFDASKAAGYSDVQIHGTLSGTIEDVAKYAVTVKSNIEGAGSVTAYPNLDEYDEGSQVKLTAAKNFGYSFINWTDAAGNVVSEAPEFTYTVEAANDFTANFVKLNTYELAYTVEGGANDYQVQLTPAPTMVDGKAMYEENTKVTLTAVSNPIMTFTNWGDGQSSSEIAIVMDADHTDVVAVFEAADYIVGWDFYKAGGNGRPADFASADNDDVTLVMRNEEGDSQGWLDKSQVAAGGYEGAPAAVNWRTGADKGDVGYYYWQTRFNASAFTDIKVLTNMLYNYNAYQKQDIDYSLDGENWTNLGSITIEGAKKWTKGEFSLPAEANNHEVVYVRFKSDRTSTIDGTGSNNDGIALGETYIIGTPQLVNDGKAPVLVSTVPAEGVDNASINGKIVLTFDEKVKVKEGTVATLGGVELEPGVTGKTVMFVYKNLAYSTDYTFNLPAGSVMDLTDNAVDQAITIKFTTKTRPVVAKALYDVEVKTVDELVAAIAAANKRDDKTKRFRIFIHDGLYKLPASETATKTGSDGNAYADPTTYLTAANTSFIGESRDGVVITNTVPTGEGNNGFGAANLLEGIGNGDVIRIEKNATNNYFQHLTIKSSMGDARGRDIEVNDNSDKTIMKDVCLWGYQDTYVSNNQNGRFYFEGGVLRGRTDYLCGKGDVYYNAVTLQVCGSGYLCAPSQCKEFGYVFKDCEIVGETSDIDGNYTLGRPWGQGTPSALFIDTKMIAKPSAIGWNEMSGGYPKRFAEYNSTTASGTVIDLKDRKKVFGDGHENNPILTKEEADYASYSRVMGGTDDWDPAADAEQAPAPANVVFDGTVLTWDNNDYASLWAIVADGKVIAFTTTPSYAVEASRSSEAEYAVRAANEMGGLGEAVKAKVMTTGINTVAAADEVVSTVYYNLQGIRVADSTEGILIKVDTLASGATVTTKVVK